MIGKRRDRVGTVKKNGGERKGEKKGEGEKSEGKGRESDRIWERVKKGSGKAKERKMKRRKMGDMNLLRGEDARRIKE